MLHDIGETASGLVYLCFDVFYDQQSVLLLF